LLVDKLLIWSHIYISEREVMLKSRLLILCFFSFIIGSVAQVSRVEFGKNRIQYHKGFDEWEYYEGENTITYWYGDGRYTAQAASILAEQEIPVIQDLLDYGINDKIEIIVFTDITDLKQTNIGQEESYRHTGGLTKILGNKIFIYFDGNHKTLRKDIREGIASVYMDALLFGSNLQEIVQNAVSLHLPEWFKEGLIAYAGEDWSIKNDQLLADKLASDKITKFSQLVKENPQLAGQAFWHYLATQYGTTSVSNLLYLVRINRELQTGFIYVMNKTYEEVVEEMMEWYKNQYQLAELSATSKKLQISSKKRIQATRMVLSPDNRKLAYVTNEVGKVRVYVADSSFHNKKKIYKKGIRNAFQPTDYEYPLIAWHPNSKKLLMINEIRDKQKLGIYNVAKKKWKWEPVAPHFGRIHSMVYMDSTKLLLTATVNGSSDVFFYYLSTKQAVRLTNDYFDDADATPFIHDGKPAVLFTSNRISDSLYNQKIDTLVPVSNNDVWLMTLDGDKKDLFRITKTPSLSESHPSAVAENIFQYQSEIHGYTTLNRISLSTIVKDSVYSLFLKDGTKNVVGRNDLANWRNSPKIDTIIARPVLGLEIEETESAAFQHPITATQGTDEFTYVNGKYKNLPIIYRVASDSLRKLTYPDTKYALKYNKEWMLKEKKASIIKNAPITQKATEPAKAPAVPKDSVVTKKQAYFESEFPDEDEDVSPVRQKTEPFINQEEDVQNATVVSSSPKAFKSARIIPYRLQFRTDFITTRMDNSPLFGGLDNFTGRILNGQGASNNFNFVPLGIMLSTNFKDLLEDYVIDVGARFPTTFRGGEYFVTFKDRKKRWDKFYSYYYSGQSNVIDPNLLTKEYLELLPGPLKFNTSGPIVLFPQFRTKTVINLAQAEFRYPFDVFRSIRLRGTVRNDQLFWKSTEKNTLNTSIYNEPRIGARAEFVIDNSYERYTNILIGKRYKFYAEAAKSFELTLNQNPSFSWGNGFLGLFGMDMRRYIPFFRHSILALRAAGEVSFGTDRILYLLGGVDNWLLPEFNNNIPFNGNGSYAFQTMAPNLRGFTYNARNGSSYGLVNAEVRVPVFRYFFERMRSGFIRNFQLVGFFDAGTAWEGISPFDANNPLNSVILENPPTVTLKVNYYRDPLVAGFGFGARTTLFGYFIRLDYGYGIETKVVTKPILYLSLGTDF